MSGEEDYHVPVLLKETMAALAVKSNGTYLDATAGGGGHLRAIAEELNANGTLVAIDRDPEAIAYISARPLATQARMILQCSRFSQFPQALRRHGISSLDGMLLDIGVSSRQIDAPERGFSYKADAPLDMRMNPQDSTSALDLIRQSTEEEIVRILAEYGEIRNPVRMARAIAVDRSALRTAGDLRRCLQREYGPNLSIKALAKLFQALRIAVNEELDELRQCLAQTARWLAPGGRLVVIAYHSLEDRIVKNFMRDSEGRCVCPPTAPVCTCCQPAVFKRVTRRAITPDSHERARNPRCRSARLRAAQRI